MRPLGSVAAAAFQDDVFRGSGSQFGLGDGVQSLFFSPVEEIGG